MPSLIVALKQGLGVSAGLGEGCGAGLGPWLDDGPNVDLDPMKPSKTLPSLDSM